MRQYELGFTNRYNPTVTLNADNSICIKAKDLRLTLTLCDKCLRAGIVMFAVKGSTLSYKLKAVTKYLMYDAMFKGCLRKAYHAIKRESSFPDNLRSIPFRTVHKTTVANWFGEVSLDALSPSFDIQNHWVFGIPESAFFKMVEAEMHISVANAIEFISNVFDRCLIDGAVVTDVQIVDEPSVLFIITAATLSFEISLFDGGDILSNPSVKTAVFYVHTL